jgi:hypothetical protein
MKDNSYFGICPSCGKTEFFELNEDLLNWADNSRVNYLKSDGSMAYKNEYIRLKKKDYIDIVCSICECPMTIIPFDICDIKQRKEVYQMSKEERIKFAERFELLDSLEED